MVYMVVIVILLVALHYRGLKVSSRWRARAMILAWELAYTREQAGYREPFLDRQCEEAFDVADGQWQYEEDGYLWAPHHYHLRSESDDYRHVCEVCGTASLLRGRSRRIHPDQDGDDS
jgi:hypothetical protein